MSITVLAPPPVSSDPMDTGGGKRKASNLPLGGGVPLETGGGMGRGAPPTMNMGRGGGGMGRGGGAPVGLGAGPGGYGGGLR